MSPKLFVPLACFSLLITPHAHSSMIDAKNLLLNAPGISLTSKDPRIEIVHEQLELITALCSATSTGAPIHDKLAYSYSRLKSGAPIMSLVSDFLRIARAQCSRFDDSMLLSLYVLERNEGVSGTVAVSRVIKNPKALIAKWSKR